MAHTLSKRQWLYALATILLLLQSFAVWHDAIHPFHVDEIQCERLSAINHLPSADIQADIQISHLFIGVSTESPISLITLPFRQRDHHTIRAPPSPIA